MARSEMNVLSVSPSSKSVPDSEEISSFKVKVKTVFCNISEGVKVNDSNSLPKLTVFHKSLKIKNIRVWKDDGSNTNEMSYGFSKKARKLIWS